MSIMSQLQLGWEMFLDYFKQVFGSGVNFTAPGYQAGYTK